MVNHAVDAADKRVKRIQLSVAAQSEIKLIERRLRTQLALWLKDIKRSELADYIAVLEKIAAKKS